MLRTNGARTIGVNQYLMGVYNYGILYQSTLRFAILVTCLRVIIGMIKYLLNYPFCTTNATITITILRHCQLY